MGLIDSEYLKANGYAVFQYQKDGKGNEGVLPVNIDDIPTIDGYAGRGNISYSDSTNYEVEHSYTHRGKAIR